MKGKVEKFQFSARFARARVRFEKKENYSIMYSLTFIPILSFEKEVRIANE